MYYPKTMVTTHQGYRFISAIVKLLYPMLCYSVTRDRTYVALMKSAFEALIFSNLRL